MTMRHIPRDTRLATVIAAVAAVSRRPVAEIAPEHDLVADLGLDSLGFISVVMHIERAMDAMIPDTEAAKAKTVADLVAILDALRDTTDGGSGQAE